MELEFDVIGGHMEHLDENGEEVYSEEQRKKKKIVPQIVYELKNKSTRMRIPEQMLGGTKLMLGSKVRFAVKADGNNNPNSVVQLSATQMGKGVKRG